MRRKTHTNTSNLLEECEDGVCQSSRSIHMLTAAMLSCAIASCGFISSDGGAVEAAPVTAASTEPPVSSEAVLLAESAVGRADVQSTLAAATTPSKPPATATTVPAASASTPLPQTAVVKINSVAEVIGDMAQMNDGALAGVNPAFGFARGPGYVMMGNDPRLTNTPSWFDRSVPGVGLTQYWNAINPYFVMFEGVGNASTNTRVHLRDYKAYWKSRADGEWRLWGHRNQFDGQACSQGGNYAGCAGGDSGRRAEPDGGQSFMLPAGMNYHGWWATGPVGINGPDIAAVFVTMQVRLTVDSPARPDDRSSARYLGQVGADYYPYLGGSSFGVVANPGVGISRSKYLTNQWRSVSMTTFRDVGQQEPGGGISRLEFMAKPPPLD